MVGEKGKDLRNIFWGLNIRWNLHISREPLRVAKKLNLIPP